jgi:hypothetical protein
LRPARTFASEAHATLAARDAQAHNLRNAYVAHKARYASRAEEGLSAMIESAPVANAANTDKKKVLADILARAKARAST